MSKAKLILEDGTVFNGQSFGAKKNINGEVVFNTGMVGYPETLTDPSYCGQILVLTYPLIGNYGVPDIAREGNLAKNFESEKIQINALIVSEYEKDYFHWSAVKSLSTWLIENKIPALSGIDTRALTKRLREKGTMLGKILINTGNDPGFDDPNMRNLVAEVSTTEPQEYGAGKKKLIMVDCGVKNNIIRSFTERNVSVIRVPWNYDFNNISANGILISNGPGDPMM